MADAEKTLCELLNIVLNKEGYQSREVEVKKISTGGANYTSALFLIHVKSPNKELKLFAKVAILGQELRELMNADWMFSTERFVYDKLMPVYNDLQDNLSGDDKFIFPKYYGCNAEKGKETVIMENLVESGYKPYDRLKSMDWDHGRIGVENLAKFHALSFAFEKRDPEEFKKITNNMVYMPGNSDQNQATIDMWIQTVERSICVLNEEHRDPVRKMILKPDLMNQYNKPIGRPVLSHGDYRLSNMLFKQEGEDLKLKVVDYQTVHAGCPVSDLLYFIFLGSDEEFRGQYYVRLLDHYYKSLEEALRRLSIDPIEVYPREKFDSDLKEAEVYAIIACVTLTMQRNYTNRTIYINSDSQAALKALNSNTITSRLVLDCLTNLNTLGCKNRVVLRWVLSHEGHIGNEIADELLHFVMLLCVMILPVVTVESDLAPKVDSENADISTFMLKTNELYSKRFRGIVDDFIKWGIISLG